MTEQERISQFVARAFRAWDKADIDSVVLRNYEGLPHTVSNDIDVLVSPSQAARAEEILVSAGRESGFRLHNRAQYSTLALYFSDTSGAQAHFDLFTALKWRGFAFLNAERYLAKKINKGLFSIPHSAHEAATNLLATMIYTGKVKQKYKPSISGGFKAESQEAISLLAETYGQKQAQFVVEAGANERWAELELATGSLRTSLMCRQVLLQPLKTAGSLASNGARLLRRYFHPPGLCIVLCGADGSGKSTVGAKLAEALSTTFSPEKGQHFHWKPPVFSASRQAARGPADSPHARAPRSGAASLFFFMAHWLEFFAGSHLRIRPVTFRGGLVLIDRYYYDFLVDQRRYRLQVAQGLVRLGLMFLKKPDLVLLLDAPAEVLQSRKQEVDPAETRRQRETYLAMIDSLPNGHVINAADKPELVVEGAKKLVLQFMTDRIERQ
jgi:thymidylate kinase